jgi:hypothetical protein
VGFFIQKFSSIEFSINDRSHELYNELGKVIKGIQEITPGEFQIDLNIEDKKTQFIRTF